MCVLGINPNTRSQPSKIQKQKTHWRQRHYFHSSIQVSFCFRIRFSDTLRQINGGADESIGDNARYM
jgi:hypothetical protein